MNPETAPCINGPKLAAWLRERDRLPIAICDGHGKTLRDDVAVLNRRINAWEKGEQASYEVVDKWLTFLGCHLSEIPDDFWEERKKRGAARRFSEFEKRRAIQLLRDGLTPTEVAQGLGCSPKSVNLWAKAAA